MATSTPQPSRRIALKRARMHDDLVDAALEILMREGVDGLTLSAVAQALDYTKPAIYHYFRSKEDLIRSVVLRVVRGEGDALLAAVQDNARRDTVLGVLVRTCYHHYRPRMHAFRLVYCKFQLMDFQALGINAELIRDDINPTSNRVFDAVVNTLDDGRQRADHAEMRALAFSAWLAAVGLVNMIGTSDASRDPLLHSDDALLNTIADTFDAAARRL